MTAFNASIAVLVFVLLVIPGMVYEFAREWGGKAAQETSFREASRVLMAGAFFTAVSVGLLLIAGAWWDGLLPDFRAWIAHPSGPDGYNAQHYPTIARTALIQAALACSTAAVVGRIQHRRHGATYSTQHPWHLALKKEPAPYVSVRLEDGTRLSGYVKFWPVSPGVEPVLVLTGKHLRVKPKGQDTISIDEWDRVAIRLEQVSYVQVLHSSRTPETASVDSADLGTVGENGT